jgi:hypothetical protein
MTYLQDLIDAEIELLGPPVDRVAPDAFGYGLDLSCVTDVTAALDEVDPMSSAAVTQAIIRRLITPRGGVIDDGAYGFDLRGYCNRGVTQQDLNRVQASVQSEARKDDRVATANAVVQFTSLLRNRIRVNVTGTLKDSGEAFKLVFFVTTDGAELEESIDKHG